MTSVTELILSSYQLAAIQQGTVTGAWITGSHILGGALPGSLLSLSIQRAGRLDTVLRCMEDEFTSVALVEGIFLGRTELLVSLSEAWVGQVYEIVRLSKERELIASSDFFQALEGDFRLLRIPGGFKPEVQHLLPSKVRRCHHLVRPRPINNFSLKSASPLPV